MSTPDPTENKPRHVLREVFGHQHFRFDQQQVIEAVTNGQSALVLMPTGGGKSLCYQIPAVLMPGIVVVISPLIAIMNDQVIALQKRGVRADFINSTQTNAQKTKVKAAAMAGELDLLYISPERLVMPAMLELLEKCKLALFAIDEAHCISQWGHDFRKQYQQLRILHQRFSSVPRLAVTATADLRTRGEIISELGLQTATHFISSFDRPNIQYSMTSQGSVREQLWQFLSEKHPNEGGIVYCRSRERVEEIAHWLSARGRMALPYHGAMQGEMRASHQAQFLRKENLVMVATIAFGMGVDKSNVRFVAHLNLPKSIENYYQETGRAGRDGKPANAWMHYTIKDAILQRNWLISSDSDKAQIKAGRQRLAQLLDLCETVTCRRQVLLQGLGETVPNPCGNCDNCHAAPAKWNIIGKAWQQIATTHFAIRSWSRRSGF